MNHSLARLLSIVFHPLLMPTILGGILFFLMPTAIGFEGLPTNAKLMVWGFLFVYTFLIPLCIIYWLYRAKMIQNLEMTNLKDRHLPFFLTSTFYAGISYFIYQRSGVFLPLAEILIGITLVLIAVTIISFFWQISAHSAGIGGIIGFITHFYQQLGDFLSLLVLLFCIIFAGFIASARLKLNAHNLLQIGAGLFIGFLITFIFIYTIH